MHNEHEYFQSKLAISKALGVHRHTVDNWEQKTWFPKKTSKGWKKEEILEAVDAYEREKEGAPIDGPAAGSREEKTALECARLKIVIKKEQEMLEQAKEQTRAQIEEGKVRTKKLIEKKEVERGLERLLSALRGVIEAWAKSAEADDPDNAMRYRKAVDLYLQRAKNELSDLT